MYQLSGPNQPSVSGSSRVARPGLGLFAVIWIVVISGVVCYRLVLTSRTQSTNQSGLPTQMFTYTGAAVRQLGQASEQIAATKLQLRQAEDQARQALALTDSSIEARHLHHALTDIGAAEQQLMQLQQRVQSVESVLKGANQ